jgi:ParB family chromosome partitioning protein|uniref:ParB/RepB/Spo0J family partition protein n=1 Tax=Coprococcus sp. TaxID=2049024 RepID=UPI003FF0DBF6
MPTKKGLGRGLNQLIPTGDEARTKSKSTPGETTKTITKEVVKEVVKEVEQKVKITQIEPNKSQPRKQFDEDALQELADSIKQYGVLEPLIVTKKGKFYEIIAGERRWRAARLAGVKEVPVVIREYTDREIMEISLIENIQREDLNPIEEALAYESLINEYSLTQEEVAEKVSKNRSTIANSLRLLKLCDEVRQMIIEDKLTTGHARALIPIEDAELQTEAANFIFDNKLSVRDTEIYIKKLLSIPKESKENIVATNDLSIFYNDIESRLKDILGAKIAIKSKNNDKGKIEINYYSQDELERITEMLYSINRE